MSFFLYLMQFFFNRYTSLSNNDMNGKIIDFSCVIMYFSKLSISSVLYIQYIFFFLLFTSQYWGKKCNCVHDKNKKFDLDCILFVVGKSFSIENSLFFQRIYLFFWLTLSVAIGLFNLQCKILFHSSTILDLKDH